MRIARVLCFFTPPPSKKRKTKKGDGSFFPFSEKGVGSFFPFSEKGDGSFFPFFRQSYPPLPFLGAVDGFLGGP